MLVSKYAAILAIFYVALCVRIILLRRKFGISVGDGDNRSLQKAICAHSNFSQYTPLVLLLIYFVEIETKSPILIHGLCCVFVFGRMVHAFGISQVEENVRWRVLGMACTFTAILSAAKALLLSQIF